MLLAAVQMRHPRCARQTPFIVSLHFAAHPQALPPPPNPHPSCTTTALAQPTQLQARTIDLCNNPKTKEPKLQAARRIIKEWPDLDAEQAAFTDSVDARFKAEAAAAEAAAQAQAQQLQGAVEAGASSSGGGAAIEEEDEGAGTSPPEAAASSPSVSDHSEL